MVVMEGGGEEWVMKFHGVTGFIWDFRGLWNGISFRNPDGLREVDHSF